MSERRLQETYEKLSERNPFPGLRPFTIGENHLFFGREGQSEIVLDYLSKSKFVAITGASGSGKSSLTYCGLIPTLYGGFIPDAGSDWKIITTRPGNSPIERLAEALVENEESPHYSESGTLKKRIHFTVLKRSSYGLVDAVKQMKIGKSKSILIIFDQFEELFRYKESRKDTTSINETEAYIKLIVNAVKQSEVPIYVVLTMRSDFIGECSQFQELTELINKSNFLIPQMTREDFKEAILGPMAVGGARIDPQLLQHILNSIEDKTDQLPVLQHVMMRTWDYWAKYCDPSTAIQMRDYEASGRIDNALSMHANEAYDELDEKGKKICKTLFKSLTLKGADNKGIRHPESIKNIAEIAQCTDDEVIEVAEKFRAPGRSFITPGINSKLDRDTVLDISHESLMRVWDKLKGWVEEEFASVQTYMRLGEAASHYQLGKGGLWRPPDLHMALNWRKTQNPTLAWARKYNPAFEKVMVFLDASEKQYNKEEQNKIRLQRRALDRTRRMALASAGFLFVVLILLYFVNVGRRNSRNLAEQLETRNFELEVKTKEADELRIIAERNADRSELEALDARLAADSAKMAEERALIASQMSQMERMLALQREDSARHQTALAMAERQEAIQETEQERQERLKAEERQRVEFRNRMLQTAQSLAGKSLQSDDPNLKGLLAMQAFKINDEYKGEDNHPDIYLAFNDALKKLYSNDYNKYSRHEGKVAGVSFKGRTHSFYSSSGDGYIIGWDANVGNSSSNTLIRNYFQNNKLAISDNGRWLACGSSGGISNNTIQLFNLNTNNPKPKILDGHKGWVDILVFSPDGKKLFSTGTDQKIMMWDLINNTSGIFAESESQLRSLSITPDGKYLLGGTKDGRLIQWQIATKKLKELYKISRREITAIAISNRIGNILVFGDNKGTMYFYNLSSQNLIRTKQVHGNSRITDIKFSPNNQYIASGGYNSKVNILKTGKLDERPVSIIFNAWILSIDYSYDGKKIVVSAGNDIYVLDAKTDYMASKICSKLSRNLSESEWNAYVGYDIDYQKTCP